MFDSPISTISKKNTKSINFEETVGFAIKEMVKYRFRRFPVIDDAEKPIGMLTSRDILGLMHSNPEPEFLSKQVKTIMSPKVIIAKHDDTVGKVINIMFNMGISGVPIIKDQQIIGMFTIKDCILLDDLWKDIKDQPITKDEGPGRPISDESIVTRDFTFWQVSDRFHNLAQREVLVKNEELNSYDGIITIMSLLQSVVNILTFSEEDDFSSLQTKRVSSMSMKPLFQRGSPMVVSSSRFWLNARGIEAFPLFVRGQPVKLITEKDLFGYFADQIDYEG